MGEGLLRQRRNLFVVCAVLWFLRYGGVKVQKLSLAGFEIEMSNPAAVTVALWLAFAYFLYRYYQYFTDEGLRALEDRFTRSLNARCLPLIRDLVVARHPAVYRGGADEFRYDLLKDNKWVYRGQQVVPGPAGANVSEPVSVPVSRWQLRSGILRAVADTSLRSSVVTDYLLPFLLAAVVLWYCGSAAWAGSFLHLIFRDQSAT